MYCTKSRKHTGWCKSWRSSLCGSAGLIVTRSVATNVEGAQSRIYPMPAATLGGCGPIAPHVCSIVARNRASGAPTGPDPQAWSFRVPSARNRALVAVRAAPGRAGEFAVRSVDGDPRQRESRLPQTHAEPNWRHSRQAPARIIWRRGSTASGRARARNGQHGSLDPRSRYSCYLFQRGASWPPVTRAALIAIQLCVSAWPSMAIMDR